MILMFLAEMFYPWQLNDSISIVRVLSASQPWWGANRTAVAAVLEAAAAAAAQGLTGGASTASQV